MQVAGPEFSDGVTVCGRTVTLVVGPFIGFILGLRSQFDHEPVSRDFGDDGCGGHGGAVPVALHFGRDFRRNRHVRRVEGVQRFGDVVVRSVENRPRTSPAARQADRCRRCRVVGLRLPTAHANAATPKRVGDRPNRTISVLPGRADRPGRAPRFKLFEYGFATVFRQHFGTRPHRRALAAATNRPDRTCGLRRRRP